MLRLERRSVLTTRDTMKETRIPGEPEADGSSGNFPLSRTQRHVENVPQSQTFSTELPSGGGGGISSCPGSWGGGALKATLNVLELLGLIRVRG